MSVDAYFAELSPPVSAIATRLRALLLASDHGLREAIKWNVPTYTLEHNVCSIMAHKAHVNLQFFQGAHIDAAAELEGTGKDMRHLRVADEDAIDPEQIHRLLQQAVALNAG